jgi:hypothetical protein
MTVDVGIPGPDYSGERQKTPPKPLVAFIYSRDQAAIDRFLSPSRGGGQSGHSHLFLVTAPLRQLEDLKAVR